MLILNRRQSECIIIDKNIKLMVISIDGNRVRLGIEAPKDVVIWREEIRPIFKCDHCNREMGVGEKGQEIADSILCNGCLERAISKAER